MNLPTIWAFLAPTVLLLSAGFAHAEPGVTDKAIVVGQSAVFSGPVAETGNNYRRGIEQLDIGDFMVEYGPANHNGSNFVELEMYTAAGDLVR
jgi:hypothetical protein